MGQTQDKSRKPIDDWGTTTQKITYEKCIRKIDEYETPINLPNYGREILNLAYNHDLKMEKKNMETKNRLLDIGKELSEKDQAFLKEYKFINVVGKGAYATVYKCIPKKDTNETKILKRKSTLIVTKNFIKEKKDDVNKLVDNSVAIKVIKRDKLSPGYEKQMKYEADLLLDVVHPNIINLLDFFSGEDNFYLVQEYVPKTLMETLTECHFHKNIEFQLSEKAASNTMKQILSALDFLKQKQIAHLDLKPDNLLIGLDGKVRICDFGLAAIAPVDRDVHTYLFCPPEIITEKKGYCESDMWACGVCFFLLLTGYFPFASNKWSILKSKIVDGISWKALEEAPMSRYAKQLIQQMLIINVADRLTPSIAMEHEFFSNCSDEPLHNIAIKFQNQIKAKKRWKKLKRTIEMTKRFKDGGKQFRTNLNVKELKEKEYSEKLKEELEWIGL